MDDNGGAEVAGWKLLRGGEISNWISESDSVPEAWLFEMTLIFLKKKKLIWNDNSITFGLLWIESFLCTSWGLGGSADRDIEVG